MLSGSRIFTSAASHPDLPTRWGRNGSMPHSTTQCRPRRRAGQNKEHQTSLFPNGQAGLRYSDAREFEPARLAFAQADAVLGHRFPAASSYVHGSPSRTNTSRRGARATRSALDARGWVCGRDDRPRDSASVGSTAHPTLAPSPPPDRPSDCDAASAAALAPTSRVTTHSLHAEAVFRQPLDSIAHPRTRRANRQ